MKFLLKQQLKTEKEQTIIQIFPNQFSSGFIKLAKKKGLVFDINMKWDDQYNKIESYEILENDFKRLKAIYKRTIAEKRKKFYGQDLLVQLILLLRYIFKRNNRAKEVQKYSATQKAYNDKQEFLELALKTARNIKNDIFLYGWQLDPVQGNHQYIYYFQIGNKQVSFHSNKHILDCPKFSGSWIGYGNERFPFKIPRIKNLI